MRIAIGGIATESCTFSPLPTKLDDFNVLRSTDLLHRYAFLDQFADVEWMPTLRARALPGGPVEMGAYQLLKGQFLDLLQQALPLDGLFLDMHGAMNVLGMDDAETDWIEAAREVVTDKCLIACSFDLHGNISQREVELVDMLTTYRTAPHVDVERTHEKACLMLVKSLRENIRPLRAWLPMPVVLPGEKTSTEWEPGLSLYASLAEHDPVPGVMDASIFVGYVWADEPRAHATITVTGTDRATINAEAVKLAQKYWNVRDQFAFGSQAGSMDECIQWALAAPEQPVFISDSGDNPTAGGVGDLPLFLERLLALKVPDAVVASIADAEATEACYAAGVGAEISVTLGGKLDTIHAQPLPVTGKVLFVLATDDIQDRQAVLLVGGVRVIVTQRRRPYHHIAEFQRLGINPDEHKIVVVKIGYLEPELKAAAKRALMALSPGAVDQAIERLPFKRIQRPMYPLDANMVWQPV
ncbi:MAG: M81 family metallopeptidase [Anaerolineae bacterium]|nr:M81 family metallopeptidase [Anaerolineae bacterium]